MNAKEYQELAMRTNDGKDTYRILKTIAKSASDIDIGQLVNACLGLSGEVGEVNEMVKKWMFHESILDIPAMRREIGDVLWYVALICHTINVDMEAIMKLNIKKLEQRYPEGFSVEKANNRSPEDK